MNEQKITQTELDEGIELFLKILAAQPAMFKAEAGVHDVRGKALADMAMHFALQYKKLKSANMA